MADEIGKVQLGAELDATGVDRGIEHIGRKLESLGPAAQKAGAEASRGIDGIGSTAEDAARKVERQTKSMIAEIQRYTAAIQSGKRGTEEFYTALAQERGIDVATLRPYLDRLTEVRRRQEEASAATAGGTQALRGMELSARQTAAALRGVPAQFTDIFTSLASGQQPITVLLQQGGQLKDMFGGVGAAARALGGYIAGMINPVTIAAAGVTALAVAWQQGSREAENYARALILSGNAAGLTTDRLAGMARSISGQVGTQREAASALAEMAGGSRIAAENVERLTLTAIRMERAIGQSVAETRKQFEELARAPAEASLKLNEVYNYLTASVYRQIRALEDQGKATEAASLAQETYSRSMQTRTAQLEENLGIVERAWKGVSGAAKRAWDDMLNVGRPRTGADRLAELDGQIATLQGGNRNAPNAIGGMLGRLLGDSPGRLEALKLERDALRESLQIQSEQTAEAKRRNDVEQARIEWLRRGEQYATRQQQMEREIAQERALGLRGALAQEDVEKRIAAIREKYATKNGSGSRAAASAEREARAMAAALNEAVGLTRDYNETLDRYQALRERGTLTEQEYVAAVERLIAVQPFARDLTKQQADAVKALAAVQAEALKIKRESYDAQQKELAAVEQQIAKLRDEQEAYGLSAEALARRTLQRQLDNDASEIARLAGFYELAMTQEQIAKIDEQIEALKRLSAQRLATAGARDDARRSDAMADAAKESERAWLRTADEINRGLTDSLFRAAESGKGAFETLRDSLKGMFANLVLRPLVQGSIGALGGLLGLTGSASAATAGGSGGGALGTLGSLASLGGALGSFGTGFASGLTAWGAGGSVTGLLGTGSALFSGGLASGLGTIAGALGPIALGVAAIMAFMKDGGGPKTGGSFSTTGERLFSPADRDDLARTIGEATVSSASQLAARFGGAIGGTLSIGFDQDPQGTAGTRVASRVIGADGRVLLDNSASRRVDDDNLDQELAAEAQRVMLAALQGANLQDGFADIFGRLDPATAAPDAIANLLLLAESLYQLGEATRDLPGAMGQIAELSATAREQLVGLAGGLDNLLQQQASFAQNFLSAQQRFDIADAQLSREFERITGGSLSDFTAGKTEQQIRDTFAQLVLGLDLTSEHGPAAYAALLAFQSPFSAFVDQMEALGKTVPDARRAIQAEMDDLSAIFGDLSTPVETVADKIARFTGEIDDLESALADILGTAEQSPLDRLRATVGLRNSIQGVRDSLADRRQEAALAGFEARGDTQGAIDYLRGIEAQLWDTLGTAVDDGSTAQKIVDVFLRRMGLEAQAAAGGSDLQLIEDARNLRIDTLRAEIDSLETISRISDDIRDTLLDLRTGSLSALSPRDQLAASRAAYEGTLAAARGGDVEALGRLSGLASGFLSEQQAFSASGGDYGSVFARVIADLSGVGASLEGADSALGVARLQLEELQKLPSAISQSVVDNSAEVLDGLAVIDERFGGVIDTLNGSIDAQVAAQLEAVAEMKGMRDDLRAEFQRAQDRWEALGAQLQQANAALAQQNAEALAGS